MQKALVIRPGTLGDIIVALPVAQTLRKNGFAVALAARDLYGRWLRDRGCVEEAEPLDGSAWSGFFSDRLDSGSDRRRLDYDLVISYTGKDEIVSRNIGQCARTAPLFCAPEKTTEPRHITDRLLAPLENRFAILERVPVIPARRDPRLLAIHPGSGAQRKNWPRESYRSLAERLARKCPVRVILGPAEEAEHDFWSRPPAGVKLVVNPGLASLAELLEAAAVYVGNDSGVTHLAAALGVPVVALFGPTDPEEWGPRGQMVRIIRRSCLDDIRLEEVLKITEDAYGEAGCIRF